MQIQYNRWFDKRAASVVAGGGVAIGILTGSTTSPLILIPPVTPYRLCFRGNSEIIVKYIALIVFGVSRGLLYSLFGFASFDLEHQKRENKMKPKDDF